MAALARANLIPEYRQASKLLAAADVTFVGLWLFIGFVSVWDGYLTLLCRHQMRLVELNPIGKVLIELNDGGITYLLLVKLIGTIIAMSWLVLLYENNWRRGLLIAAPVASFQLWLLLFLTFA